MSKKLIRWKELCDEYMESGLSMSEFCKGKGLSVGSFQYHWRRQREQSVNMDDEQMVSSESGFERVGISTESSFSPLAGKISAQIEFENGLRCAFEIPATWLSGFLESVRSL